MSEYQERTIQHNTNTQIIVEENLHYEERKEKKTHSSKEKEGDYAVTYYAISITSELQMNERKI